VTCCAQYYEAAESKRAPAWQKRAQSASDHGTPRAKSPLTKARGVRTSRCGSLGITRIEETILRIVSPSLRRPGIRVGFSTQLPNRVAIRTRALRDEYATDETILDCFFAARADKPRACSRRHRVIRRCPDRLPHAGRATDATHSLKHIKVRRKDPTAHPQPGGMIANDLARTTGEINSPSARTAARWIAHLSSGRYRPRILPQQPARSPGASLDLHARRSDAPVASSSGRSASDGVPGRPRDALNRSCRKSPDSIRAPMSS